MLEDLKNFFKYRQKATLVLAIVNVAIFLVMSALADPTDVRDLVDWGACYTPYILDGDYYRLVTACFLHIGATHLLYNMVALLAIGDMLEREIGTWRFLVIYFGGGIAGNAVSLLTDLWEDLEVYGVSAGASGAIFALIGAMLWLVISKKGRGDQVRSISPVRMWVVVFLMAVEGFIQEGTDNAAHLGGLAAGFLLAILLCRGSYGAGSGGRRRKRIKKEKQEETTTGREWAGQKKEWWT